MYSGHFLRRARSGASGLLFLLAQLVFVVLWFFYVAVWMNWTSWGLIIGIISSPGVFIFPVLYWVVEGTFPLGYFVVWMIGLGFGIASAAVAPTIR